MQEVHELLRELEILLSQEPRLQERKKKFDSLVDTFSGLLVEVMLDEKTKGTRLLDVILAFNACALEATRALSKDFEPIAAYVIFGWNAALKEHKVKHAERMHPNTHPVGGAEADELEKGL